MLQRGRSALEWRNKIFYKDVEIKQLRFISPRLSTNVGGRNETLLISDTVITLTVWSSSKLHWNDENEFLITNTNLVETFSSILQKHLRSICCAAHTCYARRCRVCRNSILYLDGDLFRAISEFPLGPERNRFIGYKVT